MIRRLNKKDEISFLELIGSESKRTFKNIIKRSGICYVIDNGTFDAVLMVEKIDNKRFIRFADKGRNLYHLLKVLSWNHNLELFWELENGSSLENLVRKFKFFPIEKKENSIIYCKKPYKKENNNGNNNYRKHYNNYSRSDK